jgi:hypothetical protein
LSNQGNLFQVEAPPVPGSALPAGFSYRDGLVSPEEERALVEHFDGMVGSVISQIDGRGRVNGSMTETLNRFGGP